ncbi:MAG: MATE family efflux transporter [Solobacterium sp.]|nr:MATE family efflux transporter [Solobacterium sp.]MDY2732142.1 MATE family efflux transporter [Erysipelotrichaceae bacterium]MDD5982917.1 MATE family efflux transporter [Solobacterium sp.]MDD6497422.1 MATE family efflux transporter [Solobacterium sp.]MDD6834340.1 MATE family efflux transporter [Solobacterium sp.]
MNNEERFKRMRYEKIPKLIISLGIPTTISMLITNIYNMADTYFVSQISLSASGATGIVFAVMAILQAFGFMCGHGSGSNISRSLGRKDEENASRFASSGLFLSFCISLVLMIAGLVFLEPLMRLLGSTDTILVEAMNYGRFIFLAAPAMVMSCVCNNILRYEGRAVYAMVGLTFGGILNMMLDPILIFVFHLGISGAGIATMVAQYLSLFILLIPFFRNRTASRLRLSYISRNIDTFINIIVTGSPSLARQGLNSISTAMLNMMAKPLGDAAIAAMSVVGRVSNMLFSLSLGIAQGFQPVSSFNYGAGDYKRVKESTVFTIGFGTALIAVLCTLAFINAPLIISLFRSEELVIEIGSAALRLMCFGLLLLPTVSVTNMLFQGIGESKKALFVACLQSGAFFIPLVVILTRAFGVNGLICATPLSYLLAFSVALPMVVKFMRNLIKKEENN